MTRCGNCLSEINSLARVCPYCTRNTFSNSIDGSAFESMFSAILVIALLIIGLIKS